MLALTRFHINSITAHPLPPTNTDKKDVLVHARGNAAKNKLLWMPSSISQPQQQHTQQPAAAAAAATSSSIPPAGSVGVMPLDWSADNAAEETAAVREAMGGPLDFVLASDRCVLVWWSVCIRYTLW